MAQSKTRSASRAKNPFPIPGEGRKNVKTMFTDLKMLMKSGDKEDQKVALDETIREELTAHTQVDEEIFYPRFARRLRSMT